jgi:CarD family transcriptional regulator
MAEHGGAVSSAAPEQELEGLSPHSHQPLSQQHTEFRVGETVVVPGLGAALIDKLKTETIKGEDKIYLVLKVGDLTIEVPAENRDLVRVGDVVFHERLDRVFEVLRTPPIEEPTNLSRRYKANLEKLASADVIKVAEVVRDLWRRDKDRGLSAGEKRMLAKAHLILVSELALAENTDADKAESVLDKVLAETTDEDEANTIQAASLEARRAAIIARLDAMGLLPSGV